MAEPAMKGFSFLFSLMALRQHPARRERLCLNWAEGDAKERQRRPKNLMIFYSFIIILWRCLGPNWIVGRGRYAVKDYRIAFGPGW